MTVLYRPNQTTSWFKHKGKGKGTGKGSLFV